MSSVFNSTEILSMHADIDIFMKTYPPKAKISCMERYVNQILVLRRNGYSNPQIRDWLELNDVIVTQEAVRKFIISRTTKRQNIAAEKHDNRQQSI